MSPIGTVSLETTTISMEHHRSYAEAIATLRSLRSLARMKRRETEDELSPKASGTASAATR